LEQGADSSFLQHNTYDFQIIEKERKKENRIHAHIIAFPFFLAEAAGIDALPACMKGYDANQLKPPSSDAERAGGPTAEPAGVANRQTEPSVHVVSPHSAQLHPSILPSLARAPLLSSRSPPLIVHCGIWRETRPV
jgi:hypothetical protein